MARAGFLALRRAGPRLCCGARAAHCGAQARGAWASAVAAQGSVVVVPGPWSARASVVVAHGL